ncbi:MAG: type II toxin-antitoxin system VapC family toxin [Gammaproteobacteria bacterium]
MIVVDTNIIAYAWLKTAQSRDALLLLEREPEWHTPLLWRSEFRNVILGEVRQNRLDQSVAGDVMRSAEQWFEDCEHLPSSELVFQLALDSGCTAYDCEFMAVAEQLHAPLVTADRALLKAFPRRTRTLKAACEMPVGR